MKLRRENSYDATVDEVLAMLFDKAYREKVSAAKQALTSEITIERDGETTTVIVDETQAPSIPSFARKFVGDSVQLVQRATWTGSSADFEVEIPGKPGHLKGTLTLTPDGARTREVIDAEVTVKVPLLGGKLEELIGGIFGKTLETQNAVAVAWLAGDR